MRKLLFVLMALFLCAGSSWAQTQYTVVPTGGTAGNTNGSGADPINRYYGSIRNQVIYTAAELTAAGIPANTQITRLAWNVTESSVSLQNYTILMGHTAANNSATHNVDATTIVKSAFTYAFATGYNDIIFDFPFTWNGTSNIVVEICTGPSNPFTSPYGGVQAKTGITNGSRCVQSDAGSACATNTSSTTTTKPYVRFTGQPATSPILSVNPSSLNFNYVASGSYGYNQYVLSGVNLTAGPIVVTAPAGFGVSLTNGGPFTSFVNVTYTPPTLGNTDIYVQFAPTGPPAIYSGNITNVGGGASTNVVVSGNSDLFALYCTSGASSVGDEDITIVQFGSTLNNTSTCASLTGSQGTATGTANLYSNFTSITPSDVARGLVVPISVQITECASSAYSHDVRVYIDFNQNGLLTDPGEEFIIWPYASSNTHTINSNISVPVTATLGNTLMRVVCKESSTTGPCLVSSYGETEDYKINITPAPSCLQPTALNTSNITSNSASINWTASTSTPSGGYDIYYSTSSTAPTTQTSGSVGAGVTTYATGAALSPTTQYYYWVRANCGSGDYSSWAAGGTFTTPCAAVTSFPYTESFAATLNPCWSAYEGVAGASYHWAMSTNDGIHGVIGPKAGTHFAFLYVYLASTSYNPYYLKTETFQLGAVPKQISYYYYLGNAGYTTTPVPLTLQISTDGGSNWTDLYQHTTANSTFSTTDALSGWYKNTVILSAYTNQTVIFRFASNSNYSSGYCDQGIDEVVIEDVPSCLMPTALNTTSVLGNSASINWTASASIPTGGYEIYYSTSSTAPNAGTTPIASVGAGVTTYPTGAALSASTTYYYWVRSNCGGGDLSSWAAGVPFTTPCMAITTLPWTEGFEGLTSVSTTIFPNCWLEETGTNWRSQDASTSTYNDPRTGTKYVGCNYGGTNDRLWTPGFQLTAGVNYDFSTYFVGDGYSGWTGDIVYNTAQSASGETTLGASFITSVTTSTSGTNYAQILRTFTPATTGVFYFGVRITSSYTPYSSMSFDDFKLELSPSCLPPTALNTTSVTSNSASINWTASITNPTDGYDIYYSTSSTAPDALTIPTGSVLAGLTTYGTGAVLSASATYYYWVRSNCGGGDLSSWVAGGTFTTMCGPISTFPYTENFDGTWSGTPAAPNCWKVVNNDADGYTWRQGNNYITPTHSTPNAAVGMGNNNDYLITPQFVVTANSLDMKWWDKVESASNNNTYDVLVSTTTSDIASFTTNLGTFNCTNTTWLEHALILSAYSGQSIYIAFYQTYSAATNYGFGIDDFSLDITPTCFAPTAPTTTNITAVGADLGWTSAASFFDVFISTTATPVPDGSTVPTVNNVSGNSYTYTGGSANNTYYWWVRTDCDPVNNNTDVSAWAGPYSFTTACLSTSIPYLQDFESATVPAIPACNSIQNAGTGNNWITASAPGSGFTSKTLRYSYNSANAANAWFYTQGIDLVAGTSYRLTFKYGNNGGTTYVERLKVGYGISAINTNMTNTLVDLPNITNNVTPIVSTTDFTPSVSGTYYLGFNCYSIADRNALFVDDILLELTPTCLAPTAPTTTNVTAAGADLGWTSAASFFDVFISTTATPVPDGSTVPTVDNHSGTSLTWSGGVPSTTYYWWVRADCNSGNNNTDVSTWAAGVPFTTPCMAITTLPWTEGFEGLTSVSTTIFPNCWLEGTGTNWRSQDVSTSTYNDPRTGTKYVGCNYGGTNDRLWTPGFQLTAGVNYDFSTYFVGDGYAGWTGDIIYNTLQSATGESTLGASFITSGTTSTSGTNYAPILRTFTPGLTGVYYFGVRITSTYAPYSSMSFDDFKLELSPSCLPPTALNTTSVTANSASINWTASITNPTDGYDIYYSTSSTAPDALTTPTGSVLAGLTTYGTGAVLSASATYYYWVRSNCGGGDLSTWAAGGTFNTPCGAITSFPWTEGFEGLASVSSTIFPNCWLEGTGTNWRSQDVSTSTYNDPRTGTKYVGCVYNGTNDRLWTPGFQLTAGVNYDFSTYFVGDGYAGWTGDIIYNTLQSATGESTLGASFITSGTTSTLGTNYAQILRTFTPATTGVFYFGVRITSTYAPYSSMSFDDFKLELSPSCLPPTALNTTSVTGNSASINWTASTSTPSGGYDIYYSTSSTVPTSLTTPTGSVGAGITTYPTGAVLSATTMYYFWVRSNCGSGDYSSWAAGGTFTTPCATVTSFPYTESFAATMPNCWSVYEGSIGSSQHWKPTTSDGSYVVSGPFSGTHFMYLHVYLASTTYNPYYLETPSFDLGATLKQLKYHYYFGSNGSPTPLTVQVTTDFGATWTTIYTHNGSNSTFSTTTALSGWKENVIDISAYANQTATFRFVGTSNYSSSSPCDMAIDEFVIEDAPSCIMPSALNYTNLTSNSASINWTASTSTPSGGYDIYYSTSSTAPDALTTPTASVIAGVTTFPTGAVLSATTMYYYWVRSNCGSGDYSSWAAGTPFTTMCGPISTFPYTENFDGTWNGTPAAPNCWKVVNNDADGYTWRQGNNYITPTHSTPNAAVGMGNNNDYLITPQFVVTANSLDMKWWDKVESASNNNTYDVLVSTTTSDITSFTTNLGTFNCTNTTWLEHTLILSAYSGQSIYIAFHQTYSAATNYGFGIDDFSLDITPTCFAPTALITNGTTTTTADVQWTSTAGEFEIEYGVAPYTFTGVANLTGIMSNSTTIGSLSASAVYQYKVKAICGVGDESLWSAIGTFTTQCGVISLPYAQNFDFVTAPTIPICMTVTDNNSDAVTWVTNASYSRSAPNCMYISFNSSLAMNDWFFTPAFNLTPGTYNVSFWYRNSGTTFPEKLEVKWGNAPNAAGMTSTAIFSNVNITNATYAEGTGSFTVTTAGVYYVGWHGFSNADEFYLVVDDILINAVPTVTTFSGTGNWNDAMHWDHGIPTPVTDVFINGSCTLTSAGVCDDLTINPNMDLTVNSGQTLTINGQFLIASDASGTGSFIDNGTITYTGNVTMQRYMPNRRGYHYYSSPFNGASIHQFDDELTGGVYTANPYPTNDTLHPLNPLPNFFLYNETNPSPTMSLGWDAAGLTLETMRGYCINFGNATSSIITDITGVLNSGNKSINVTRTSSGNTAADGWNLVGNPYPSPINWDEQSGWTKTNVDNGIYYWKATTQYLGTYSSYVGGVGVNGATAIIPSMQGFMVRASSIGTGTLGVTNAARVHAQPTFFKSTVTSYPLLRLQGNPALNSSLSDETVIYFNPEASFMFDGDYDAYKMMNNDPAYPNIFTSYTASPSLSINALPPLTNTDVVIPLGFITKTNGSFKIKATEILNFDPSLHIYLEDNQNSTIQDLTENPEYTFSMSANAPQYRFFIRFSNSLITGIADNNSSFVEAWSSGYDIYVNCSGSLEQNAIISVYNMLGQQVISEKQTALGTYKYTMEEPGCYIVKVLSGTAVYQKKVIIM